MNALQELLRWLKDTNNAKAYEDVVRFTQLPDEVLQAFRKKWEDQDS